MLYEFFSEYYIKNKALCLIIENLDSNFWLCIGKLCNHAQVTLLHWVSFPLSLKWEIFPKHMILTNIKKNIVKVDSMKIRQKSKFKKK